MIEEHVETGLKELLAGYRTSYIPGGMTADQLDDHFTLLPGQPLPAFSHAYADAYEVSDSSNAARHLYGMVLNPDLPPRTQAISDAIGLNTIHVVLPIAGGTVRCSHINESRFMAVFEQPQGRKLSELIESGARVHEAKIIDLILDPICKALIALRSRKVHHGNIHPGTVFISDTAQLGECFSAPAGTLGHYLYEPVERLMADTLGHGEPNEKTDVYALGILVFEMLYGLDRIKTIPREEFIERVLRQGAYTVFSGGRDFSDAFQDFFRGVFNDNAAERWSLDQLAQFIGGKRFNMIAPSLAKDASRPYVFGQEEIFSRRVLANTLHRNWREATRDIRALKLERWCETSLHRPELAERIDRVTRHATANSGERQTSDAMMRVLCILDPTGPLRSKTISVRPDSIPIMLAELIDQRGAERSSLFSMIETDVSSYWVDQLETNRTPEISQTIWRLKRVKPYLESRALGFGIERILYELNPSLCCQSPLLKPYHVTTIPELLGTLDALARHMGEDTSLVDRHIAAFIAAKLDIVKEIRLDDINIPTLMENQELVMLRLLVKAQQKHIKVKLVGLCAWCGMRIEKMIDEIHNRIIRKRQKLQLKKLASSGHVKEVLSLIINRGVITRDMDGFAQAIALHEINTKRIEYLQNPLILEYKSRKSGGKMAVAISYLALSVMGYHFMVSLSGI